MQRSIMVASEPLTLNGDRVANDGALRNISGANFYNGAISLASDSRVISDAGTMTICAC